MKQMSMINVLVVNNITSMFMYAENFREVENIEVAIAQYFLRVIEEVGLSNVLQIVIDNATNCKAAGRGIQKVHKHIFWSSCVVHT